MEYYLSRTSNNNFGSNKKIMISNDSRSNLTSPRYTSYKS